MTRWLARMLARTFGTRVGPRPPLVLPPLPSTSKAIAKTASHHHRLLAQAQRLIDDHEDGDQILRTRARGRA